MPLRAATLRFLRAGVGEAQDQVSKRGRDHGGHRRQRLAIRALPDEVIATGGVDHRVIAKAAQAKPPGSSSTSPTSPIVSLELAPVARHHAIERGDESSPLVPSSSLMRTLVAGGLGVRARVRAVGKDPFVEQ